MEELIAMLMDLLMLKQNLVQSMELGENGVTGKHALHLAMADNKSEKIFDKKTYSNEFKKPFAEMAQELLKNDKFQGKLKKFLGEISKPKGKLTFDDGEVIDAEMDRWAFNRPGQPNTDLTPIQKNEVKEFIAMTREPDFNKSVFRIVESVLNNKDFKKTMREVLNKMSIKVEDKRGNSKKDSKPIKLTEDSMEYEE